MLSGKLKHKLKVVNINTKEGANLCLPQEYIFEQAAMDTFKQICPKETVECLWMFGSWVNM